MNFHSDNIMPSINKIIEHFQGCAVDHRLLIASGVNNQRDIDLVAHLANEHQYLHCVVVPYTISEERLNHIRMHFTGNSLLYSECDDNTDFATTQVLVVDYVGNLASIYCCGAWAYCGSGFKEFATGLLAPIAHGLPVACGMNMSNRAIPKHLIEQKVCSIVRSTAQISRWFENLLNNEVMLGEIKDHALAFSIAHGTNGEFEE